MILVRGDLIELIPALTGFLQISHMIRIQRDIVVHYRVVFVQIQLLVFLSVKVIGVCLVDAGVVSNAGYLGAAIRVDVLLAACPVELLFLSGDKSPFLVQITAIIVQVDRFVVH